MIVLDENLGDPEIAARIAAWYPGRVAVITELRPHSVIKDESISTLLRGAREPTFVTLNVTDFWRILQAESRFAIVCMDLPISQDHLVPLWLRRFLSIAEFKAKSKRMGVVALLRSSRLEYYRANDRIQTLPW